MFYNLFLNIIAISCDYIEDYDSGYRPSEVTFHSEPELPCGGLAGKKVKIFADTGDMLLTCNNCGPGIFAISVLVYRPNNIDAENVKWRVIQIGEKCALLSQARS